MAAVVRDQSAELQLARCNDHRFTSYAQHVGDALLRHVQLDGIRTVEGEQQPAAKALVERMVTVARCRLRRLHEQRLDIAQQDALQRAGPLELALQDVRGKPHCAAAALHGRSGIGLGIAQHQRDTDAAFLPDERNLRGCPGFKELQNRDHRARWKIKV